MDKAIFTTAFVVLIISEFAILSLLLGVWRKLPSLFWPYFLCNVLVILLGVAIGIYFFTQPARVQVGITITLYMAVEPYFVYAVLSYYMKLKGSGVTLVDGGAAYGK